MISHSCQFDEDIVNMYTNSPRLVCLEGSPGLHHSWLGQCVGFSSEYTASGIGCGI